MRTRVGKIARLPRLIREQLNQRLENGEPGAALVQWLNQLPEVEKIIIEQFAGQPIRPQNLSDWKKGGYADWLRHQQLRQFVRWNSERADDLNTEEGDIDISDSLGSFIAAQLLIHVRDLEQISDAEDRWRRFREVARELSRLRRDDRRFRRFELRKQQWESTLEPLEEETETDSSAPLQPEDSPPIPPPAPQDDIRANPA
jgi:hypothetical protein